MSRANYDRIYSTPGLLRFEIHELDERLLAADQGDPGGQFLLVANYLL